MWSLPSPHPEVVNLVPTWASPSPGEFVPHLDLIAVDTFLASPGSGNSDRNWAFPDLVTLVLKWASPGPSEYAPSGPHLDLVTLVTHWASSGNGSTAWPAGLPHLDL